jgi:hypothetical protein
MLIVRRSYFNIMISSIETMAEKIQFGEITQIKVNDEAKSATFAFNALGGDSPLGFKTLRLTKDNENAYNAMLTLATLGLQYGSGAPGGQHVHVRYDDGGSEAMELDEISIHQ